MIMQIKSKLLFIIIFGITLCIAGCGIGEDGCMTESYGDSGIIADFNTPECFELINEVPHMVRDGQLYRYIENEEWLPIETEKSVVQLVSDEYLCGIYDDGTIFYDGNLIMDEYMPNGSGYVFLMINKLFEINRDEAIQCISEYLGAGCIALLKNGEIFYPNKYKGEYISCQMEEYPISVSGSYILTDKGNVFYLDVDTDYTNGSTPVCVYSGEDIVEIDGTAGSGYAVGLTKQGKVVSWVRRSEKTLAVETWDDVVSIESGHHFAVGLTKDGSVLFAGNDRVLEEKMQNVLADWKDVVEIAVWGIRVCGITAQGECIMQCTTEF